MSAAVGQGTVIVVLVLEAVGVELLVAVGASPQGVEGGTGAAARHGGRTGGTVLAEACGERTTRPHVTLHGNRSHSASCRSSSGAGLDQRFLSPWEESQGAGGAHSVWSLSPAALSPRQRHLTSAKS